MTGFISVRRLAALDMALHGAWFVVIEFGAGVLLPGLIAAVGLARGQWRSLLLWYFLCVSLNYVPLLVYSLLIHREGGGRGTEAGDVDRAEARRYTRQQFWLLVPLAVFAAAVWQELRATPTGNGKDRHET